MTTRPTHHPDDETLFDYAAARLDAPWELALAVHLAACPRCRATVAGFEEAGGAALDDAPPAALDAPDAAALIARADAEGEAPRARAPAPERGGAPVFPEPLRSLSGDADAIAWSPIGGGVKQKILMRDGGVSARLLHIDPGVAVAAHGHRGVEFTAVLAGGYFDGDQAFTRGDIQIVSHAGPHKPTAMTDQACICLAVTDAPLKFRGWLPRLAGRLARI